MNFAIVFNTDALTGLMNRSAAVHYAKRRIAAQPEHSINIVILNLDCFRNINNNYGHVFGDEVLYQTGKIIKTETGSRGIAGRIGSDEFMMVIEGTIDEIDLRGILRAVRTKIELSFAGRNIKITCSMGIASYPKDSLSYDELFAQANHALCIAKQKGGNRYVIYDSEKHGSPDGTISRNNPENSRLRFVSSICREIFTSVNPDMNIDSFVFPASNNAEENVLNSGNDLQFSVMKNCKHKEEAYEVLRFFMEDENVQSYIDDQSAVPCKKGDFELPSMLDGMKEYINEGKLVDYQDHHYPSEMSVDAMIQTYLLDDSENATDKFLKKFDTEWVRYNRDLIQKVQDYEKENGSNN